MTANATGRGDAAVVPLLSRILTSAERLRSLGAEPRRAIAIPLRDCDLPDDVAAVVRAAWASAVGSDGSGPGAFAVIDALSRFFTLADLLCSIGVEPREVSNVLRDAPGELTSVARDAWTVAVGSGAVVRAAWSVAAAPDGAGPGVPAVLDALSRLLTAADLLCSIGVEPREVINVLRRIAMPRELAAAVRAAWTFAVGLDDDGDVGRSGMGPKRTLKPRAAIRSVAELGMLDPPLG